MVKKKEKKKRSLARKISNTFIALFVGLILLLLLIIGVSQTSTFRNYLRDKVSEVVNSSINGTLHIGSIDGTLLSTISIKDISLVDKDKETVFYAGELDIKISLPRLLSRTLYFREVNILEAQLNLLEKENGQLNIETLLKPTEEDTVKDEGSSFPFLIQVNKLNFENLKFIKKAYEYRGTENIYKNMNLDDLVINKFNFSAQAIADLDENDYSLVIDNLSFSPNVERFDLETLSGTFVYQNKTAVIRDVKLISDDSNINLDARIDSIDLFNDFSVEKLQDSPVEIKLALDPFQFDDLASFFPKTELFQHKVNLLLEANGTYGDLTVENLDLDFNNTRLQLNGNVKNLSSPDNLYFDVNLTNSTLDYNDVRNIMPDLELPDYKGVVFSDLNIHYTGSPTNFKTRLNTSTKQGSLTADVKMNLNAVPAVYDVDFETSKLDISPILGMSSRINSKGKIKGKGFEPTEFNTNVDLSITNSRLAQFNVENLQFNGTAKQKVIELTLSTLTNDSQVDVLGEMDFTHGDSPSYNLKGDVNQLNLASVIEDTSMQSDLNFTFEAVGKDFDIDSLQGRFNVSLDSSTYQQQEIPVAQLALSIHKDSTNKIISLSSDFVDFEINGQFSLQNAIDVLTYQGDVFSKAITKKIDEFNPLYKGDTTIVSAEIPEDIISTELAFDYSFTFKDFSLIAAILGEEKLDISGDGEGYVSNTHDMFEISTDIEIDYFLKVNSGIIYISNLNTDFRLSRNNASNRFDNLFGSLTINCERFYTSTDIQNIQLDVIFNENNFYINASANVDDMINFNTTGNLSMNSGQEDIKIDDLSIVYNGVTFQNLRPILMTLKVGESLDIEDFSLYNKNSALHFYGIVYNDGRQDVRLDFNNINGGLMSRLMGNENGDLFNADMNVNGAVTGTFENPLIDVKLAVDSVAYNESEFGSFVGNINYKDKNLTVDAAFADSTADIEKPRLVLGGNVPVDLSFTGAEQRVLEGKEIDLELTSNNFNISALGNIIPQIKNQSGIFKADIQLNGTLDNPKYSGSITLSDTKFLLTLNNLEYSTDAEIIFDGDSFNIEKCVLKNEGNVPHKGTMNISGEGQFDGFVLESAEIKMNGDLTVLDDESQVAQPSMYGELFVGTNGDWVFQYEPENSFFKGNVEVKEADMVVVSVQSSYTNSNNFKYIILEDTTHQDTSKNVLDEYVEKSKSTQETEIAETEINFDYSINVNIASSASLEIVLSQLANQKLIVELTGSLTYEKTGENTRAQGAFDLMTGSKLEFFRTFEADGTIRFESDITDPYLDIVATYQNEYTSSTSTETEEVAVKLKLQGPVSQLGTNLASNPENISVYSGARNIENNVADDRYDAADAISFILTNRFKDDLTAQNRQEVANQTIGVNTAASFLGSILSSYVNSAVGDAVNNIQIGQSGEYTKFIVSGRFSNFRYSLGSTTEYIDDVNKASLRLDYLFSTKFLIRLERKDPVEQAFGIYDKITELGIKYTFEF